MAVAIAYGTALGVTAHAATLVSDKDAVGEKGIAATIYYAASGTQTAVIAKSAAAQRRIAADIEHCAPAKPGPVIDEAAFD